MWLLVGTPEVPVTAHSGHLHPASSPRVNSEFPGPLSGQSQGTSLSDQCLGF